MEKFFSSAGGTEYRFEYLSEIRRRGSVRQISVYLPALLPESGEVAFQVFLDGQYDFVPEITEKLIREKAIPPMVTVGIAAAEFPPALPGGTMRSIRSHEYDGQGSGFAELLTDEILPDIEKLLPEKIKFSENPDMHAIAGCSSGGICSWNACFERNDFFRRTYINSPTFSAFKGGESVPFLIRKYEPRKIRVYMTVGTDDMENSAGNWYLEALSAQAALKYAGYEHEIEIFPDGLHGVGHDDPVTFEKAQRFIWKDWQHKPVQTGSYPPRIADIVSPDTSWERCDSMPELVPCRTANGKYIFDGCNIILVRNDGKCETVAKMSHRIAAMTLSSDLWRLYVAVPEKRFIYVWAIYPDGSLHDVYAHGHLHIKDDFSFPGANDICVDTGDRVYAATELGIQTFSVRGHNNTILPLPGNPALKQIAFGADDPGMLYVRTVDGMIFKRPVNTRGRTDDSKIYPPDTPPF